MRSMRPRQWTKNLLVVAAPLAAGQLFHAPVWWQTAVAFLAFCALSGAVYLVNDVVDVESDRAHPRKRLRPIAAGELSVRSGLVAAVVLGLGAVTAGTAVSWNLGLLLVAYAVLQAGYSLWLKHEPVFDLAVVSVGFLMRAVAGGLAAGLPLSGFFLMVAGFGSLFMVAGKRYSEVHLIGEGAAQTRRALEDYSASYLRFVWGMAGSATIVFYSLWAFTLERDNDFLPQLSIAPFVFALLRYAVDIDRGEAGEPESIVLGDRGLQVLGVLWLLTFTLSVVVG